MTYFDAVAVFGSAIDEQQRFPLFVYRAIDRAMVMIREKKAGRFIFCGSHAYAKGSPIIPKWQVAWHYMAEQYPDLLAYVDFERMSTSIVENWLYMKMGYPEFRSIHLVTISPLLARAHYLGDMIYGDDALLNFEIVPGFRELFPHDRKVRQNAECALTKRGTFGIMRRGDHTFLLGLDGLSRWPEIRIEHRNCPKIGDYHY